MSSTWSTLSPVDKQAFYSILDEYFESRPHLLGQQTSGASMGALTSLASAHPGMAASALKSAGVPPSLAKPSTVSSASKHLNGFGSKVGQLSGKFNSQLAPSDPAPAPQPTRTPSAHSSAASSAPKFPVPSSTPSHQSPFAPPPVRRVTPSPAYAAPPPRPVRPRTPDEELVEAMYDYDGTSPEDLSFKERQVIKVTEHISDDWWNGQIANGPIGMFPSSYVKPL